MKNPKFQIFVGTNNQFYFRLIAASGEIIMGSEGYISKTSCEKGINSVKTNAPLDHRYQRKTASNGQFYFIHTAANGEPIGTSEMYTSESALDNGIEAVKKTAPGAAIEDIS